MKFSLLKKFIQSWFDALIIRCFRKIGNSLIAFSLILWISCLRSVKSGLIWLSLTSQWLYVYNEWDCFAINLDGGVSVWGLKLSHQNSRQCDPCASKYTNKALLYSLFTNDILTFCSGNWGVEWQGESQRDRDQHLCSTTDINWLEDHFSNCDSPPTQPLNTLNILITKSVIIFLIAYKM